MYREPPIELKSQGTYGCFFRPGLKCNGPPLNVDEVASKLQKTEHNKTEVNVSSQIRKIPNYAKHFAPILRVCRGNEQIKILNTPTVAQLHKCNIYDRRLPTAQLANFEVDEMEFVGDMTLDKGVKAIISNYQNIDPHKAIDFVLNCIEKVYESVGILYQHGIIHFDLKPNNIVLRGKGTLSTRQPVVIDFGMSILTQRMQNPSVREMNDIFFHTTPYQCWTPQITFLATIAKLRSEGVSEEGTFKSITLGKNILNTCKQWANTYPFDRMTGILSNTQRTMLETYKYNEFRDAFNRLTNYNELIRYLQSSSHKWDVYSLAVMSLVFFSHFKIDNIEVKQYKELFFNYICGPLGQQNS